jgi:hypothetical protein
VEVCNNMLADMRRIMKVCNKVKVKVKLVNRCFMRKQDTRQDRIR